MSASARSFIMDGANRLFVSAATSWEIAIKYARGRMPELPESPDSYVPSRMSRSGFEPLAIVMDHTFQVAHLPAIHRDPFDRLLIAQAQVERLPIVTNDPQVARYDIEVIW